MKNSEEPSVSIIIPCKNEEECIASLCERLSSTMKSLSWEAIIVDDYSTDNTSNEIDRMAEKNSAIRATSNYFAPGKDYALLTGLIRARGKLIVTMDGDLQDTPEEIPMLLKHLDGYDMVCGFRTERQDSLQTRVVSHVANTIRNRITGVRFRDAGCNLKAFRREHLHLIVDSTPKLHGCAHYFFPALFSMDGLSVKQVPVSHAPRKLGQSKFNLFQGRVLPGLMACIEIRKLRLSRET